MGRLSRLTISIIRSAGAIIALAFCATGAYAVEAKMLPVPNVVIYPGDIISDQVLKDRPFKASWAVRMPVYKARDMLVGKVARRTLLPGKPIALNAIRVPDAVKQGKTYRIEFRASGLVISGFGKALSSGAVGEMVSLRNPDSGLVVRGIVGVDGIVRVSAR